MYNIFLFYHNVKVPAVHNSLLAMKAKKVESYCAVIHTSWLNCKECLRHLNEIKRKCLMKINTTIMSKNAVIGFWATVLVTTIVKVRRQCSNALHINNALNLSHLYRDCNCHTALIKQFNGIQRPTSSTYCLQNNMGESQTAKIKWRLTRPPLPVCMCFKVSTHCSYW